MVLFPFEVILLLIFYLSHVFHHLLSTASPLKRLQTFMYHICLRLDGNVIHTLNKSSFGSLLLHNVMM